jgi:positive regulator of sigma E activity
LQYLKYVTLNVFLIMASMGALQIGFLDPIVMMYRALTTVFARIGLARCARRFRGRVDGVRGDVPLRG